MVPGWSPTKIIQMVLIGCISRSRGQKLGFQNAIFKNLLVWNYQAQRFHSLYVKPLSHQSGVLTAFPQRFKKLRNAEVRAVQTPATLCKCCGNAVQSPRTPCGCVHFGHAQNKRHGLAFAQRVRQNDVATLWGLLERRGSVVSRPCARCKDAV